MRAAPEHASLKRTPEGPGWGEPRVTQAAPSPVTLPSSPRFPQLPATFLAQHPSPALPQALLPRAPLPLQTILQIDLRYLNIVLTTKGEELKSGRSKQDPR